MKRYTETDLNNAILNIWNELKDKQINEPKKITLFGKACAHWVENELLPEMDKLIKERDSLLVENNELKDKIVKLTK